MVPVIPTVRGHDGVEVRVRVDYPCVLTHGPAYVKWAGPRHGASQERESRLLVRRVPVVGRYRAEHSGDWMNLAILQKLCEKELHYNYINLF